MFRLCGTFCFSFDHKLTHAKNERKTISNFSDFFFYNLAQEKKPPPLLPTIQWTKLTKKI